MELLNPSTTRSRSEKYPNGRSATNFKSSGAPNWQTRTNSALCRFESIQTVDGWWPKLEHWSRTQRFTSNQRAIFSKLKNAIDWGNNFTLDRSTRSAYIPNASYNLDTSLLYQRFEGPVLLTISNTQFERDVLSNLYWPSQSQLEQNLLVAGTNGIKQANPIKRQNDLLVGLLEIFREGIPKLAGMQTIDSARKGGLGETFGSEFLNVQFGWAPLLSDLQALIELVNRGHIFLSKYQDLVNKETRRRYTFPSTSDTDSYQSSSSYGLNVPNSSTFFRGATTGRLNYHRTYRQTTWFSGAFKSYQPISGDTMSTLSALRGNLNNLAGFRLTPDLLWELMPWSWLIDWFLNIGDILTNVSYIGTDSQALRYAYIMQTTSATVRATLPGCTSRVDGQQVGETYTIQRKARRRSTPFGFGLDPGTFSPKQWAILGALGMTQAPNRLF